jgi:hypothetical protein
MQRFIKVVYRFETIFLCCCLIFLLLFTATVSGEESSDDLINATLEFTFISGTNLSVDITLDVQRITIDRTYTAQEIASASEEEIGALSLALFYSLRNQLEVVFADADLINFERPTYSDGEFHETLNVLLTSAFFGLNDTVSIKEFINGVFDMGAIVSYDFPLQAEYGWNNTYTFVLPSSMSLHFANTAKVNYDQTRFTWVLENWNGEQESRTATLSTRFKNPTTKTQETDEILLEFAVDASNVETISLTTTIIANIIDISGYDVLPSFISNLNFIPADGVRLFIDNAFFTWSTFYNITIEPIQQKVLTTIRESSLNESLELTFFWKDETTVNCTYPYNISQMDTNPSIQALLFDQNIDLQICGISARGFLGLVNAGASVNISSTDINFGENLDEIGLPYSVFLKLPAQITLDGKTIYSWNSSTSPSGEFSSTLQPDPYYSQDERETYIEIEIPKFDLNIPSFFTGKTELTATAHITEQERIYVTSFPKEFTLPEKIDFPFMNADAFRLCIEDYIFHEDDVNKYLINKRADFEERVSSVFKGLEITGVINRESFDDSLSWDGDIANMENTFPIIVSLNAHRLYSHGFGLSLWPPTFSISNQSFSLTSLRHQTVTYRLLFPKGIAVNASGLLKKSIIQGETNDGRKYLEVSFSGSDNITSELLVCSLSASPLYVIGLLLPCILSLVLVIILLLVYYLIRKKRKGGKIVKEEKETTGYEGEDFYVPPPPSSK